MKSASLVAMLSLIFGDGFELGNVLQWSDATHKPEVQEAWVGGTCPTLGWSTKGHYTRDSFTVAWTVPCLEETPLRVIVSSVEDPSKELDVLVSDEVHDFEKDITIDITFPLPWKVEFPQLGQVQILKEIP